MRLVGFILEALAIGSAIALIFVTCVTILTIPSHIEAQTTAYLCVESWKLGKTPDHCEQFKDGKP